MHRATERMTAGAVMAVVVAAAVAGLGLVRTAGPALAAASQETPASAKTEKPGEILPDTLRQLEVAAEKDTASYDKAFRLGVAYLDHDRALEAVNVFQRCVRLRPKEGKAWVNLGVALDGMGRGPDARVAYRTALGLNPDDEIALCRLGSSHYATGSRAATMDTLRLAIKKFPNSYCAYFTLGIAFADAQMFNDAIRAWEKVVEVAPKAPEAQSAKESIATLRDMMKKP